MEKHLPPHVDTRQLVLSLIKEDLRCSKLVLGLSSLGLDAGKYHTEISNLVFNLLGLDLNNDQLLSLYFECIDKASEIEDVEDQKKMQGMAEEILNKLEESK